MKAVCELIALSVSDFKRLKPSHSAMGFMGQGHVSVLAWRLSDE
jgi:hypothetical protein